MSKFIAPEALFWFRWAALFTWVMGVILAFSTAATWLQAFTLGFTEGLQGSAAQPSIGLGMWLATIMFINVWATSSGLAQKIALGLVEADADAKAAAACKAMLFLADQHPASCRSRCLVDHDHELRRSSADLS